MMTTTDFILKFANTFLKKAQSQEHDYSFVDKIRQSPQLGKKIEADAFQALQDNSVHSIDIRVDWNKPTAEFEVWAQGDDADKVQESFKKILDSRYSKLMAAALSKQTTPSFRFGLMTVS